MSLHFLTRFEVLLVLGLALAANPPKTAGQTPAILSVQVSGGAAKLNIAADASSTWTIEYVDTLSPSNNWVVLTNVTLSSSSNLVLDGTAALPARRFYRAVLAQWVQLVTSNLTWISPGTFIMGSPTDEVGRDSDETQHSVTLTQGFFIGQYLVTQGQYLALMSTNPCYFNGPRGGDDYGTDLSRPVETVAWFFATNYCALLTQQEQQAHHIPTNWVYRLPTEAEWEYACRAGATTEFSYGEDPSYTNLASYAWYDADSNMRAQAVGRLLPNVWGLYDMEGDVFEWCQDWYGPYPAGSVTDPQGPSSDLGSGRVFRGGGWAYGPTFCRCAGRYSSEPELHYDFLGLRVVLSSQ